MPLTLESDTAIYAFLEDIPDNSVVHLFPDPNDNNVVKVRLASNDDVTRPAEAFVRDGGDAGTSGEVYLRGQPSVQTGTTLINGPVFLGTNGGVTQTPPTVNDTIVQPIGNMIGATVYAWDRDEPQHNVAA